MLFHPTKDNTWKYSYVHFRDSVHILYILYTDDPEAFLDTSYILDIRLEGNI